MYYENTKWKNWKNGNPPGNYRIYRGDRSVLAELLFFISGIILIGAGLICLQFDPPKWYELGGR
jgi:hypothetical protein